MLFLSFFRVVFYLLSYLVVLLLTLILHPWILKLPGRTIQVRRSMIKVETDSSLMNRQSINSMEVVTTRYFPFTFWVFDFDDIIHSYNMWLGLVGMNYIYAYCRLLGVERCLSSFPYIYAILKGYRYWYRVRGTRFLKNLRCVRNFKIYKKQICISTSPNCISWS